ncbi:MAG TPA: hypothetical protein VMN03_17590, partial [Burkholderiales bacterium]|nr:hypothetical protein [Burkholderiales bacterium]
PGGGGASPAPPVAIVAASRVIDENGGTLAVTGSSPIAGTQAVLPAGALSGATTVTFSHITGAAGVPGDVLVVELGPAGTVFSQSVTVTLKVLPQYLTSRGISDPTTLKIVALGAGASGETLRTVAQDPSQSTVSAQITRAGRFAVLGYSNATVSGSYGFNFTIMDSRFRAPVAIQLNVPDTPFEGSVSVPFPGYAFASEVGTIAFDGAGNYSWSGTRNNGGTPTAVSGSGIYSVDAEGRLALDIGPSGGVLAGGSAFVLTTTSGDVVEIGVGVKLGGAYGNASLSGSYGVAHYYSDAGAGPLNTIGLDINSTPYSETVDVPFPAYAFNTELRTATFNGAGSYSWSGTRKRGSDVSAVSGSGTYAVAGDGTLTLDGRLTGHLLAGGSTFLLTAASGQPIEIGVGLRRGGSFSAASLGGTYTVALNYADPGAAPAGSIAIDIPDIPFSGAFAVPFPLAAFSTELRTVTFNGAGSYTWSGIRNRGGVSSPVSGNGTYAVAGDGRLTTDGGLAGYVLAGGSTFVLTSTSGQAIRIGVGILR